MILIDYQKLSVTPWETASDGEAIACSSKSSCSAETVFSGDSGFYDIFVQYYDQNNGVSHFNLYVKSELVSEWAADDRLPSNRPNGDTSTRHNILNIKLEKGDHIRIEGKPDSGEHAVIDYIEILAHV